MAKTLALFAWLTVHAIALGVQEPPAPEPPAPEPQEKVDPKEKERREEAIRLNNEALEALERKEFDVAIDGLARAHRLLPKDEKIRANLAEARRLRGDSYLEQDKFHFARADYLVAKELEPEKGIYPFLAALVLHREQRWSEAAQELQQVLKSFPRMADAYYVLGDCQARLHDIVTAVATWKQGLQIDPHHMGIREALARHAKEAEVESGFFRDFTPNFIFHYDLYEGDVWREAPTLGKDLEDAYNTIQKFFLDHVMSRKVDVVLYQESDFRAVTQTDRWVGGLFDGRIRIPVNFYARERAKIQPVLRHELAHAFLADIGKRPPVWLNEGLAQLAEGDDPDHAFGRLRQSDPPRLLSADVISRSFVNLPDAETARLAYDQSLVLVARLEEDFGRYSLLDFVRVLDRRAGESDLVIFAQYFLVTLDDRIEELRRELQGGRRKRR